jgi:hypothetical protein
VGWCDGALIVGGLEVDAFADQFHSLLEVFWAEGSAEDFSGGQRGGNRMFGVCPCLEERVRPELDVVSDGVYTGHGYLTRSGGARVNEESAEVVYLSDFFVLRDSKSSGGNP